MESNDAQAAAELGFRRTDNRYSDHKAIAYEHEGTFEIDGRGGERINKIMRWWLKGVMVGLTIQTNRDREHEFLGSIVKSQNCDGLECGTEEPGNRTIVGFWARMDTEEGFENLGLVLC
ncbi:hypothetical protein FVEN_g5150 [Fusarium venenatum]|uniref:Uncharacterized protein n=1 Tax=Fusarium venenatum TaxID=56646 RepID=A0A2L2T006_9HYPO|nr:uncharacterized protein FVRRES_07055 [Fusarium venenatum]KAG8357100.1 hypothetical protein FVEN_g5150 [Fusarium venenatum]CEI62619.1 unnamed protein product [Fusarium venenatum]